MWKGRTACLGGFVLFAIYSCAQSNDATLAGDAQYAQVDTVSTKVVNVVGNHLKTASFKEDVLQVFDSKPSAFLATVFDALPDGNYRVGKEVFPDVKAAAIHAKDLKENLKRVEGSYENMGELFKQFGYSNSTKVTAADVRQYFRFTIDFLRSKGFANEGIGVKDKYSHSELINVMRTGAFITQLPEKDIVSATAGTALADASSNSAGAGASGAADTAGAQYTGTRYTAGANSCQDYKTPAEGGKKDNSDCISPSEGSELWPEACTPNADPKKKPICNGGNCGKQVTITNTKNGQSRTATICGACPKKHDENSDKGEANPCDQKTPNIDITDDLAKKLGFGDAENYQKGKNETPTLKATFK